MPLPDKPTPALRSLSFALAAATISSAVLLVFLKQSQAEDHAREYFSQAA
jgi:hypothetical protein